MSALIPLWDIRWMTGQTLFWITRLREILKTYLLKIVGRFATKMSET